MRMNEILFSDFKELLDFLKKVSKDELETFYNLTRFFKELNSLQITGLFNLVIDLNEEEYNNFISIYPDIEFDPTGKQEKKLTFSGGSADVLDVLYNDSLNNMDISAGKVIREAKDLTKIGSLEIFGTYFPEKILYLKNPKSQVSKDDFEEMEKINSELFGNSKVIPERIIRYMKEHSPKNARVFLKHITLRMRSCKNNRNCEYFEKLNKIAN